MKLPRWLSKKAFAAIQEMEPEDALNEVERLKQKERERKAAWWKANPDKAAELARKWRKNNRKKARAQSQQTKERIRNDPDRLARQKATRAAWESKKRIARVRDNKTPAARKNSMDYYYRCKVRSMARDHPDKLRKIVNPMVPGYLQPAARADVINTLMEMALANKVDSRDIKSSVKQCIAAYNRQFDHFKNVLIDAPIAGTDNLKRSDLIDSEAFHF